ncbi:hypothetical protein SDRG_03697 [Saprolegnia diclina VS20]|uniref:TM7S3/TM198-like domain-containing protein n=1 Tax=Saprolegnia diclina (strain VS20) TaxID=1156394 RepID=T0S7L9_SAPDV|nr:hypothetical protein SDRG_03697 [Saprolegnia diclina VS20]EQC38732.1 hypothetical protein SDRG_03697 [Saprolegnia diclina VS20]|eukprot:XP_008607556.1 hypothetical protein SDRG_03697 [Saprolegnia diclina VS20]
MATDDTALATAIASLALALPVLLAGCRYSRYTSVVSGFLLGGVVATTLGAPLGVALGLGLAIAVGGGLRERFGAFCTVAVAAFILVSFFGGLLGLGAVAAPIVAGVAAVGLGVASGDARDGRLLAFTGAVVASSGVLVLTAQSLAGLYYASAIVFGVFFVVGLGAQIKCTAPPDGLRTLRTVPLLPTSTNAATLGTALAIIVLVLALPITFVGYKFQVLTGAISSFLLGAAWSLLVLRTASDLLSTIVALAIGVLAAGVAARFPAAGRFGTVALAAFTVATAVVADVYTYYALLVAVVSVATIVVAYLSYNSRTALILSSAFAGAWLLAGAIATLTSTSYRTFDRDELSFGSGGYGTVTIITLAVAFLGGLLVQLRFTAPVDATSPTTTPENEVPFTAV